MARYELLVDTIPLDLAPDRLIPLEDAVDLPRIEGLFSRRSIQRAAEKKQLRTAMMRGRLHTTVAWVDRWIEDSTQWHDRPAPPASSGSAPAIPGKSATSETTENGSAWDAINALRRRKPSSST